MAFTADPQSIRDFVSHVSGGIDPTEFHSVIRQVTDAFGSTSTTSRDESLVASGAALGIEHAQAVALRMVSAHAAMIGGVLLALEGRIADAQDDPALCAFLAEIAAPIRATVNEQVEFNARALGDAVSRIYGIRAALVLAREASAAELSALEGTAAIMRPHEFRAFMLVAPEPTGTTTMAQLMDAAVSSTTSTADAIAGATSRYGSLRRAMQAFDVYILRTAWRTIDEVEAAYIPAKPVSPEAARQQYHNLMDRVGIKGGENGQ